MQHEIAADRIAAQGLLAGKGIWAAVEAAYEAGMNWRLARIAFDGAVEAIADGMEWYAAQLFAASAYEAIPVSSVSLVERAEIDRNANDAHRQYVDFLIAEAAQCAADYAYDTARDARLLGAA